MVVAPPRVGRLLVLQMRSPAEGRLEVWRRVQLQVAVHPLVVHPLAEVGLEGWLPPWLQLLQVAVPLEE